MTVILAPILDVTDRIFRNCFHQYFGYIDRAVTPFVSKPKAAQISMIDHDEIDPEQNALTIEPQVLTNSASDLIAFAEYFAKLGLTSCNLNLGCPFPRVRRKMRGSGLLIHPDVIDKLLEKYFTNPPLPLSIKIRLGLHNPHEIGELIPVINRYPLKEVTIHPRTGTQMYSGNVHIDLFAQYYMQCKMPVIYNGDIFSSKHFTHLKKQFPSISSWMIGRGVLIDPFLPGKIKGISFSDDEKKEKLICFYEEFISQIKAKAYRPKYIPGRLKELWNYHHRIYPNGNRFFKKLCGLDDTDGITTAVLQFIKESNLY